mmetsp:Transcript_5676/g.6157  ORF Transcript_5676/g.6157 Transcript_5676/m.6157 type:complete len:202 (+) Transcript_5676:206-811(+)
MGNVVRVVSTTYRHNVLSVDEIVPGLFLSSVCAPERKSFLESKKVTHVLSMTAVVRVAAPVEHLSRPLWDDDRADLISLLPECTTYIDKVLSDNGVILVHCRAGQCRSVSVVLAYLMRYKDMTYSESVTFLKARRPYIDVKKGFKLQLDLWGDLDFNLEGDTEKHETFKSYLNEDGEFDAYRYCLDNGLKVNPVPDSPIIT